MLFGLDCLGLARFGDKAKEAFPKEYALGVFSRTFGDAMPAVKEIVAAAGCKALRVQLIWSDRHEYSDSDIPTLKKEAKRWDEFAKSHAAMTVYLSPFCEHNVKNPDKYLDLVKEAAPSCEPVNTPWKGAHSKKYINEVHGGTGSAVEGQYIFSYDGTDMLETNLEAIKRRHRNALLWFGWTANFNGITETDGEKIPREERTAWPSVKLIRSVTYVMENAKGEAGLPDKWIWKSHAEDKGNNDPRANKPVLIAAIKAKSAELLYKGKVVMSAPYYGPYVEPLHRYYFPKWGYEMAQEFGTPLEVAIGNKVYGKVNPAFREGVYR